VAINSQCGVAVAAVNVKCWMWCFLCVWCSYLCYWASSATWCQQWTGCVFATDWCT